MVIVDTTLVNSVDGMYSAFFFRNGTWSSSLKHISFHSESNIFPLLRMMCSNDMIYFVSLIRFTVYSRRIIPRLLIYNPGDRCHKIYLVVKWCFVYV